LLVHGFFSRHRSGKVTVTAIWCKTPDAKKPRARGVVCRED
jgi:hypothetical protein